MRKRKLKTLFVLALLLLGARTYSQSVIPFITNVAGGSYDDASSYARFEWSLGELTLIESFVSSDIAVTHGVLQPCTEKVGASPFSLLFAPGEYRLFPNPTTSQFELNFFVRMPGQMTLELLDMTGRSLEKRSFRYNCCGRIERFDLSGYPNGTYMIMATLQPDRNRPGDNIEVIRHSGIRVVKISN